jgi:hypothetical protein
MSVGDDLAARYFLTPSGRKLLLTNKRNRPVEVEFPEGDKAARTVDEQTGDSPRRTVTTVDGKIVLESFAVTMVSW